MIAGPQGSPGDCVVQGPSNGRRRPRSTPRDPKVPKRSHGPRATRTQASTAVDPEEACDCSLAPKQRFFAGEELAPH